MQTLLHTLLSVCAFESPGLRALGCPWLPGPVALFSVLSWLPTPRARKRRAAEDLGRNCARLLLEEIYRSMSSASAGQGEEHLEAVPMFLH